MQALKRKTLDVPNEGDLILKVKVKVPDEGLLKGRTHASLGVSSVQVQRLIGATILRIQYPTK